MKVKFRVLQGAGVGREFAIRMPKCLIGRSAECHLRPDSEAVSSHHCVVYAWVDRLFVRDLKSNGGTFVNGQPIQGGCELKGGDELRIGSQVFRVEIEGDADEAHDSATAQGPETCAAARRMLKKAFGHWQYG